MGQPRAVAAALVLRDPGALPAQGRKVHINIERGQGAGGGRQPPPHQASYEATRMPWGCVEQKVTAQRLSRERWIHCT